MQEFYDKYCKKRENQDELYFFNGYQGEVELNKSNIDLQKESEVLLVRYASPKSNFDRLRYKNFNYDEDTQKDDTYSFESELAELEKDSQRFVPDLNKNKEVYFLPTNLESIVKQIINGNKRKVPDILIPLIPKDIQGEFDFIFTPTPLEIVTHENIGQFATSFIKLEDPSSVREVKEKMDYIKHNINDKFVDGIDDYFVGDLDQGFGMMERDFKKKYTTPSTFHYNFVLRNNDKDSMVNLLKSLSEEFRPFPFE
ncbi:hypothetical protein D8844_00480 [Streptococcus oralis]|uniref:Uncharacterized protein n=1 Tax=Streptococcus oralis TaxID=1303 RepID=A0A428INH7_STROR|nr:hypothetical protein [Streptococcus oralis]RSK18967.1 hypothetical protein D8844_00480 [Streptococcus oralis]